MLTTIPAAGGPAYWQTQDNALTITGTIAVPAAVTILMTVVVVLVVIRLQKHVTLS